jgi:hypothetical protein
MYKPVGWGLGNYLNMSWYRVAPPCVTHAGKANVILLIGITVSSSIVMYIAGWLALGGYITRSCYTDPRVR